MIRLVIGCSLIIAIIAVEIMRFRMLRKIFKENQGEKQE